MVEKYNEMISKALFKRMTAEELLTQQTSTAWVQDLPKVIAAINKKSKKRKPKPIPDHPVCSGDSCNLLNEGTKVRRMLDEPRDMLSWNKEPGKFRAVDIRWDPQVRVTKLWYDTNIVMTLPI